MQPTSPPRRLRFLIDYLGPQGTPAHHQRRDGPPGVLTVSLSQITYYLRPSDFRNSSQEEAGPLQCQWPWDPRGAPPAVCASSPRAAGGRPCPATHRASAAQGSACLRRDLAEILIQGIQLLLWPPARVTTNPGLLGLPSVSIRSSTSRDNLVPDRPTQPPRAA